MLTISDTRSLARFCDSLRGADFIAVDTEFMRERTYWPILCLVQVTDPSAAAAIDLAPLWALLADEQVLKVFHAACQDISWGRIGVRTGAKTHAPRNQRSLLADENRHRRGRSAGCAWGLGGEPAAAVADLGGHAAGWLRGSPVCINMVLWIGGIGGHEDHD